MGIEGEKLLEENEIIGINVFKSSDIIGSNALGSRKKGGYLNYARILVKALH